ncbi:MAG: DUF308 domain-containing protein [Lachnospiraceae bacterium]|nr:DUF308 domain-containing protein [Lachnospiraceae bacterium]
MEKIKRNIGNLLVCLSEIVVGILLLIDPVSFTSGIIITLGILLAVFGVASMVSYFRAAPEEAAQKNGLAMGLIAISVALVCIFRTEWFIAAFPLITVFYGVIILLSGISKIQWAVDMLRLKQKYWFVALVGAALSLVFAAFVLINPFSSTIFLWNFIAISMIIAAVVDILTFLFGMKRK